MADLKGTRVGEVFESLDMNEPVTGTSLGVDQSWIRLECLKLAVASQQYHHNLLDAAQRYYDFVTNTPSTESSVE